MHIDITEKNLRFRLVAQSGIGVLLSVRTGRQNGECYPSVGRIAEDLSLSTCTVFRAFNELEKRDLLERFPRYHPQGGRRSSLYRIKGEITKTNRSKKRGGSVV